MNTLNSKKLEAALLSTALVFGAQATAAESYNSVEETQEDHVIPSGPGQDVSVPITTRHVESEVMFEQRDFFRLRTEYEATASIPLYMPETKFIGQTFNSLTQWLNDFCVDHKQPGASDVLGTVDAHSIEFDRPEPDRGYTEMSFTFSCYEFVPQ